MAGSLNTNTALGNPAVALTPSSVKATLSSNYISTFDFMNQYLPDTYESEFERYGNRSIASFLRNVSAEIPSASDLIKWAEQGRLHTKFTGLTYASISSGTQVFTMPTTVPATVCNFRVNQTVFLSSESTSAFAKGIVTAVANDGSTFTVAYYDSAYNSASPFASGTVTAFVYGSEFKKGVNGMVGSLDPKDDFFEVKPVIIKDKFEVAGSDMAQIGWVEVTTENGATGYLWYVKAEHETRLRFDDYLEMMMIEHVSTDSTSGAATVLGANSGSEGMFEAIEDRGNVWSGGNPSTLGEFDDIVARLDKQGAIAENVLFVNREFSFDIDDMLAAQNSYGVGGTSYGLFDNDKDMALNLGFTSFRRGYDFYKSDWKYLNDATLRGGLVGGAINGVLIPAGTMSVYDQVMGKNMKRPFLHVRYRANEAENRKFKTWVTGSAGGAENSDLDAMQVHFLSERALCTLGANNFVLFKD
jgi:hypothetical protein